MVDEAAEKKFRSRYPALWKRWKNKHPGKPEKEKKPPPANHRRAWTAKEERDLLYLWGAQRTVTLAKKFGRTAYGINDKAKMLGLGPARQGKITLTAFAKMSGFNRSTIKLAAKRLNIYLRKSLRVDPRWSVQTPNTWYAVTEEQQGVILHELLSHPDGERYRARRKGEWESREPPRCLGCAGTEIKHYALGLCTRCYDKDRRRRKREEQGR
ncbi:MAG: hypothetical protein DRQ64_00230 [Gammaproteobacteria bacterium]|nr:MAG: hypothetical protein DRQ64_00230 [Gammaproteobacteria bacterium]